ncbi:hypothetical protein [Candidatus Nanohalococcus occultus]|uniref:Uncharacterized protein n=1 Tax=Candidatus Nanohalococcus occultus TaxID=2978047 RepID=A0ABY8CJK8_9ARCH|nr:hypothetical protein SVXNc_0817 [Candidatus Nanohaloarchaeota archaeon SVXNc]
MNYDRELHLEIVDVYEEVKETGKEISRSQRPGNLNLLLNDFARTYGSKTPEYTITDYETFESELDFLYRDVIERQVFS